MAVRRGVRAPAVLGVATVVLLASAGAALAQTAVKYRDANGQWIFTDQAPSGSAATEALRLPHESEATQIEVKRVSADGVTRLLVTNHYPCVVNVRASVDQSTLADVRAGPATLLPSIRAKPANCCRERRKAALTPCAIIGASPSARRKRSTARHGRTASRSRSVPAIWSRRHTRRT